MNQSPYSSKSCKKFKIVHKIWIYFDVLPKTLNHMMMVLTGGIMSKSKFAKINLSKSTGKLAACDIYNLS